MTVHRVDWDFASSLLIQRYDEFVPKFNKLIAEKALSITLRDHIKTMKPGVWGRHTTGNDHESLATLESINEMLGYPDNMKYLKLITTPSGFTNLYKHPKWPDPVPG